MWIKLLPTLLFEHYRQGSKGFPSTKQAIFPSGNHHTQRTRVSYPCPGYFHCNALYVVLPWKIVTSLMQNASARLSGEGKADLVSTCAFAHLFFWDWFTVLNLTLKALGSLGPDYLRNPLHPYEPVWTLGLILLALLSVLSTGKIRKQCMRDRVFSVAVPVKYPLMRDP